MNNCAQREEGTNANVITRPGGESRLSDSSPPPWTIVIALLGVAFVLCRAYFDIPAEVHQRGSSGFGNLTRVSMVAKRIYVRSLSFYGMSLREL